jgi:thiol-disulfide isomerase/thioredoxin
MNDERMERLIAELDVPVEPRREFTQALLARLERELERPLPEPRRLPWIEHPRRNVFYAAAALVVLVVATIVIALPTRASAASTIRQAQQDIARLSLVRATIRYDINPDGSAPQIAARGATADIEVTYVRGIGYRQQLVGISGSIPGIANSGFIVWDGTYLGSTWSSGRLFVIATRADFEPLRELGWNSPYPDWESICTRGGSELLADAVVAGRDARHVRCGDLYGGFWELWIDRETGFMLKIQGALGRDDFKLATSAKGGFEVARIEYSFDVDRSLFVVPTPPEGLPTRPPATQPPAASPDAYAHTSLRKGEIAPSWSGQLIDGGTFRLEETHGRPLLVLFWADWCPRGDPACDVLRQLDEVSRRYAGRAYFASVDLAGTADAARQIMRDLGYSFPVVVTDVRDPRIWDVDVFPFWVLLDRDGRVVEARLRPQTVPELETMLRAVGL